MEVDVQKNSSPSETTIVPYNEAILYENNSFQILDSGIAAGISSGVVRHPQKDFYQPDRYEQLSNSWTRPPLAARKMKSKLFRSSSPQQKSTYQLQPTVCDQDFLDETSRAVSSVKQPVGEEEIEEEPRKYRTTFPQIECQPSTSQESSRIENRPLQRLTLQIGKKLLRFKVVDSNPVVPASIFQDASGKFRCASCRLMFRTHDEFQKHNKNFHGAHKGFVCVVCGTGFTNKASLTMHHRIHSGFKSHECNICHKVFSRASNLMQHVKMHQSGRHHFCEMCGRCFKDIDQMMEHQATCVSLMNGEYVQLEKPLRYQCGYCEKLFHHKRDKFIHERIHTGEKPYQCGYCGRGFTQSQALTIHIRNHTGERPFNCGYCSKQFKDSSSLRKHEFRYHIQVDFMDYEETNKMEAGIVEDEYEETIWK